MKEDIIKEALRAKALQINPTDSIKERICKGIEKKEAVKMINIKKTAVCICAAALALTTVALGAGKAVSSSAHSDRREAITHIPTEKELMDSVGYAPKFTEELGGYKFISAQPTQGQDEDKDGNVVSEYKEMNFFYKQDDGILSLGTRNGENINDTQQYETVNVDGVKAYYTSFTYMSVPPDYKPTAEEKAAEEAGELQIGYGSDKISKETTNFIIWYDDGITYHIMDMGCGFTKEDMTKMAHEVINSR